MTLSRLLGATALASLVFVGAPAFAQSAPVGTELDGPTNVGNQTAADSQTDTSEEITVT